MKGNRLRTLGFSIVGALALFLASCGQQPPPSNGGGNGGGSQPTTGTLEVTVLDNATGNPIQGASVVAQRNATPYNLGTTNAQGKVSATLEPGTYNVTASANGYQQGSATATVTAGQTTTLTLRLLMAPPPAGPGVCVPGGDTSFSFRMQAGSGGVIKSIQRTNASGEDCFVKGSISFTVSAPGASSVQIALGTTDNFQAGQVRASGTDSATLILDTATLPQGVVHYVIARVQNNNRITDQYYRVVPDNVAPQLPDVRPVNKLNPDNPANRWVNGTANLVLQNPDFKDNPNGPGLLASGVQKVVFRAKKLSDNSVTEIGEASQYPYTVAWDTTKLADGRYQVYAVAVDAMGNESQGPFSGFVVGVDNTAPTVDIQVTDKGTGGVTGGNVDIFPALPGYVSGVAKVDYCADDTGVGITTAGISWGSGAGAQGVSPAPCRPPYATVNIDVNSVDNGEVTFTITAQDLLGNKAQKSVTVIVDNNAPTLDRFMINGQASAPNIRVNAGSQATYEVLADDPTSDVREVRYYYAAPGTVPWTDGGLLEIGKGTSALSRVVFPVLDPGNLKSGNAEGDLWVIALAVDEAGNAKAFYQTLKVVHTANKDNGVDGTGATLTRTSMPGGQVEHTVTSTNPDPADFSNVLKDGSYLYVAYYAEGTFDGSALPQGMPSGVTTTVRTMVQLAETYPYQLLDPRNLNALLVNEYGHWADKR